jgi:hypothetical protein
MPQASNAHNSVSPQLNKFSHHGDYVVLFYTGVRPKFSLKFSLHRIMQRTPPSSQNDDEAEKNGGWRFEFII